MVFKTESGVLSEQQRTFTITSPSTQDLETMILTPDGNI